MMPAASPVRLSKSKIAAFEHCPRRLWLQIHRREVGQLDEDTLARFKFGHEVGSQARLTVPGGIMVEAEPDIATALETTAQLMSHGPCQPIFEATFQFQDVLVRVDILEPDGQGAWRAIEVKASARVKAYQLADLATQIWVMQGCGVVVSAAIIRHLRGPFSWNASHARFRDTDVSLSIERFIARRNEIAQAARLAVRGPEIRRAVGPHCRQPFTCEFQAYCSSHECTAAV